MTNLRTKTVLVWEPGGIFVEMAKRLAKDFGRVLYCNDWVGSYPTSRGLVVGSGDPDFERVVDPWAHYDEIDLWVFPDVYNAGLHTHLREQGKRVWGCGSAGSMLELDRVATKKMMAKAGLPVGGYKEINGVTALRRHLKRHENQFVKLGGKNGERGDIETLNAPNYEHAEPVLDELEHRLGARAHVMDFVVEDAIDPAVESGWDGIAVDGRFWSRTMSGVEKKDQAYVCKVIDYAHVPKQVSAVNEAVSGYMRKNKYRGSWSTEVRITPDGNGYLIDGTARCGSPPSELMQIMCNNLSEVIWEGADGVLLEPDFGDNKWGAEVLLHSTWADSNYAHIRFPSEFRENIKLRHYTVIDGDTFVSPQSTGMPEIGAVVATGKTAKEAIDKAKAIAEKVESHQLEIPVEAMDEALEDLNKILGSQKPASKEQRSAEDALKSGRISQRQYDKLAERNEWS
jgi:phosphoribosylamine-glycine ligase